MKKLLLFTLATLFITISYAQVNYVFQVDSLVCPKIYEDECHDVPYMSKALSVKLAQFDKVYTKTVDCGPPAHMSSIEIAKPDVYYSVKKLSKYYCKGLKKGKLNIDKAESELSSILDKCMAIYAQETKPIESELKTAAKPEDIILVFDRIILE